MIVQKFFSMNELAPMIEQMVNEGRQVRFTVTGNSMFPLFASRRDQVTVQKADIIKKYDIVLHRRNDGRYILHRVIGIKNGVLTIAGDNEIEKEKNVTQSMVIAKVTSFVRKGKQLSVTDPRYRVYSRVWLFIFPLRHFVLNILLALRRLFRGKK